MGSNFTAAQPCSQIRSPLLADKVDYGIGLSYRPIHHPTICSLTSRYDNPMHAQSTLSPQSGTMNSASILSPRPPGTEVTVPVINLFVAQDIALVCRIVFFFFILLVFLLTFSTHIVMGTTCRNVAKSWCIHYIKQFEGIF
jgi:hypothetical protein